MFVEIKLVADSRRKPDLLNSFMLSGGEDRFEKRNIFGMFEIQGL